MGEIVRYKRDVWGEEVILGVSWDLLWVVPLRCWFFWLPMPLSWLRLPKKISTDPLLRAGGFRHESIDRTFHWLMAASIFVLIFTGTAPILG